MKHRHPSSSHRGGNLLLALLLTAAGASSVHAHSDAGKLKRSPTAIAVAQVTCGPNENGNTATYNFRVKNNTVSARYRIRAEVSKTGLPSASVQSGTQTRAYGAWGSLAGGNGIYDIKFSKVGRMGALRRPAVFTLEHHCSAANGNHTENESFVWIQR